MKNVSSLAVYCGSKSGNSRAYSSAAQELGKEMAARRINLVFGGGSVGIMGELANSILSRGGQVTGVIPHFLDALEVGHKHTTELIKVESMHIRKETMFKRADGFVILPGGLGTLEECFEVIAWKQLKLHSKPIVVLNIEDYWQNLAALVEDIVDAGFAHSKVTDLFTIVDNVRDIFTVLEGAPETGRIVQ